MSSKKSSKKGSKKSIGIHIFRRDLRLSDNHALYELSKKVSYILPIFIFDTNQIEKTNKNKSYRSDPAVKAMCRALEDLDAELKKHKSRLYFFHGIPHEIIYNLIKKLEPTHVSYNADFSKYSLVRDSQIDEVCKHIELIKYMNDLVISEMSDFLNKQNDNKVYKVFGSFYKNAIKQKIIKAVPAPKNIFIKVKHVDDEFTKDINMFYEGENNTVCNREKALSILKNIKKYVTYDNTRDDMSKTTTNLSTCLKFGVISILETYNVFNKTGLASLIKQLYWRQYYFVLARYYYNEYEHKEEFYKNIKWKNDLS